MTEEEAKLRSEMIQQTSLWIKKEIEKCMIQIEKEKNKKKKTKLLERLKFLKSKAVIEIKEIDKLFRELGFEGFSGLDEE